jgi:hypothetical protein
MSNFTKASLIYSCFFFVSFLWFSGEGEIADTFVVFVTKFNLESLLVFPIVVVPGIMVGYLYYKKFFKILTVIFFTVNIGVILFLILGSLMSGGANNTVYFYFLIILVIDLAIFKLHKYFKNSINSSLLK